MSGQFLPVPILLSLHGIEASVGADSLVHWFVCSTARTLLQQYVRSAQSLDFFGVRHHAVEFAVGGGFGGQRVVIELVRCAARRSEAGDHLVGFLKAHDRGYLAHRRNRRTVLEDAHQRRGNASDPWVTVFYCLILGLATEYSTSVRKFTAT